jgi:NAD+ diphosphatase
LIYEGNIRGDIMRNSDSTRLPFNAAAMGDDFAPLRAGDADPGQPGVWIIFRGDAMVLEAAAGVSFIEGELPEWAGNYDSGILIGSWKGKPVRVLEIGTEVRIPPGHIVEPLLHVFFLRRLPDNLVTLAGRAQQILAWVRKSTICSCCGGRTVTIPGTWGKRCLECGYEHFPHIHPCTLVLVRRENELLLVRKREWPEGYYSIPSGFCDFGESLEECARREVEEETGIRIRDLRYAGSQSWPFPAQLMIGFTAEYDGGEIVIDHGELEDAAWFSPDSLPPTFSAGSIAGWILEMFGKS